MNYLTYGRLIPQASEEKDFSELEASIKGTAVFREEARNAECIFVRGSILNAYDGGLRKAHKDSDIDLVRVSNDKNRRVNQHYVNIETDEGAIGISIDATNLNFDKLMKEANGRGDKGLTAMTDIVQDTYPLLDTELFLTLRDAALFAYLRLGMGHYREYDAVTTSGAMKAIQQARLIINPLRWWSIEYAYKASGTAGQNILRYYRGVESMLGKHLDRCGQAGDEPLYAIPGDFRISTNTSRLKFRFWAEKAIGRLHSSPIISLNDLHKIKNKLKSLIAGALKGKKSIDDILS